MSKRDKYNYWTSMGIKPKGFSFVKGQPSVYTHIVDVYIEDNESLFYQKTLLTDQIFIKIKIKPTDFGKNLDTDFINNEIKKEVGSEHFKFDENIFKRDADLFPYVTKIHLYSNVNNYVNHRKILNRRRKLDSIINNLK